MIVKPYKQPPPAATPRLRAGAEAERQMAHYLNRRFNQEPEVHVLHDLRLVDDAQLEQTGASGVCQIDHLLVHRWGMFIIESKSVSQEVRVRPDGSDGDEWSRVYQGKEIGMPSPIQQARRQSEFLRVFLQRYGKQLLGQWSLGSRTLAKFVWGTDQRGFTHAPIQLVIAVSDSGKIRRVDGWQEPQRPFRVFVTKADLVPDKISQELEHHRQGANVFNILKGEYGLWSIEAQEAGQVAAFLAARHVGRAGATPTRVNRSARNPSQRPSRAPPTRGGGAAAAVCKHCGATDMTARWGKYGYYWRCGGCGKNTAMPLVCSACGTKGRRGGEIRVHKDGPQYIRDCKACGTAETIWTEK